MKSLSEAREYLSEGRSKVARPLPGRSTRVASYNTALGGGHGVSVRHGEMAAATLAALKFGGDGDQNLAIWYHGSPVVVYRGDGVVMVDSCGWRTSTTKHRISEYSPFQVYQERGIWYAFVRDHAVARGLGMGGVYLFSDGMGVSVAGIIFGAKHRSEAADQIKAVAKLRRRVQAYAKSFVSALLAGDVAEPSGADCFLCAFGADQNGKRLSLGELSGDSSHLMSHIDEGYYVPSLLINAMEAMGASAMGRQMVLDCMTERAEQWGAYSVRADGFLVEQVRRSIARYMLRQLGQAS